MFTFKRAFALISLFAVPLRAQTGETLSVSANADWARTTHVCRIVQGELAGAGLENVLCQPQSAGEIIIVYENRRYRHDVTALGVVLQSASNYLAETTRLTVMIEQAGVPAVAFRIEPADLKAYAVDRITARELGKRLHFIPISAVKPVRDDTTAAIVSNSSFRKFDVKLQPGIGAQLGNRDDPYKIKVDFLPGISTVLTRGLTAELRLYAKAVNMDDSPVFGAEVNFRIIEGSGALSRDFGVTDETGVALTKFSGGVAGELIKVKVTLTTIDCRYEHLIGLWIKVPFHDQGDITGGN